MSFKDAADKIPPRRSAVSAECTSIHEVSSFNLKAVKKSNEARERIENALRKSYLFISLDKEQTKIIVDAVEEIKFKAGNTIIEQGASGDHFYLLEEGECEAWIKFSEGEPQMVKNYVAGDSFGELALLYNSPRAATVKATTDCVLGAVDRNTFRAIVMITTREKRELYEEFLEDVPILKTLTKYERSTIADILQEEYFESGETIIVEGQKGEKMYFLEDGEAEAQTSGKVVMEYKRGDYFGELALLDDKPRQATVMAVTKCKCASIDRDSFKESNLCFIGGIIEGIQFLQNLMTSGQILGVWQGSICDFTLSLERSIIGVMVIRLGGIGVVWRPLPFYSYCSISEQGWHIKRDNFIIYLWIFIDDQAAILS